MYEKNKLHCLVGVNLNVFDENTNKQTLTYLEKNNHTKFHRYQSIRLMASYNM